MSLRIFEPTALIVTVVHSTDASAPSPPSNLPSSVPDLRPSTNLIQHPRKEAVVWSWIVSPRHARLLRTKPRPLADASSIAGRSGTWPGQVLFFAIDEGSWATGRSLGGCRTTFLRWYDSRPSSLLRSSLLCAYEAYRISMPLLLYLLMAVVI